MSVDPDTFLVTVYVLVDTLYQQEIAPHKPRRRGRRPRMHDSEVLTLVIIGQWLSNSERQILRYAHHHWRSAFPQLLSQSAFNRRARDLAGVLVHLIPLLAAALERRGLGIEILDGVPLPLARIVRGKRHRLFADEAAVGRGGTDRPWFYGCKLEVADRDDGVVTGFVLGPASTEERWLAEALLGWRQDRTQPLWTVADLPPSHRIGGGYVGPTGLIWPPDAAGVAASGCYLSDGGLTGRAWQQHWQRDYAATVLTPAKAASHGPGLAPRTQAALRQTIETVNAHLVHTFQLAYPLARSRWGLLTRVAAKLAAVNLGIWVNRLFGRPDLALRTLFAG